MTTSEIKPKKNYLNNKDMLAAVIESRNKGDMTKELAKMLQMLCYRYAQKGCFVNYSYNEDMQAFAIMMLVRTWKSFDPSKSSSPFAFFTQCIKNSYKQYLKTEKKYRNTKDEMLINMGFNPSHTYTTEHEMSMREERYEEASVVSYTPWDYSKDSEYDDHEYVYNKSPYDHSDPNEDEIDRFINEDSDGNTTTIIPESHFELEESTA